MSDICYYYNNTRDKPLYRGIIHLNMFFILNPFFTTILLLESNNLVEIISIILFYFSCFCCYGFSYFYHCNEHKVLENEVYWGKMDNLGIAIMMSFNSSPVIFVLIPEIIVKYTIFVIIFLCILSYNIFTSQKKTDRYKMTLLYFAYCLMIGTLVLPAFLDKSNDFEKRCWFYGFLSYFLGSIVYVYKTPELWPDIFGYHELFHAFTAVSGVLTFLCNYSVISRIN